MTDKPATTMFIASCGWGWGQGLTEDVALYNMAQSCREGGKQPIPATIYKVSEDWSVYDTGRITATYLKEVADANITDAMVSKAKDLRRYLEEAIDYKDEDEKSAA
jgi:hypothetical protein